MLMPQNHEASEHPSLNENWPRQRGIELGIVCSCLLVWKPNSCRVFFVFAFWKKETESTLTGTSLLDTGLEVLGIKGAR